MATAAGATSFKVGYMHEQRRPWLGFAGMLLLIAGGIVSCQNASVGIIVVIIGAGVLGFALITGNVKLFG